MILIRSALFLVWFVTISVVMYVLALPSLVLPRGCVMFLARIWARVILFGLKWIAGLGYEVRGREYLPTSSALVASKHYSTWETIALFLLLPDPAIVLKRELMRIPLYGWYARKMQMISVDRTGGSRALRTMHRTATRALAQNRQVVIFPEGTRRRPGDAPAYKPGVAGLYAKLGVPCVPVVHNSGLFWLRRGFVKKPGTIVVEFLPPIPPGLSRNAFSAQLQDRIETAVNRLIGAA